MRLPLARHADTPCDAVARIEVDVVRAGAGPDALALRYMVAGRIGDLVLPPVASAARRDGLWQHICFELFIAVPGEGYREFNFAPSGEWAAYGFSGYRIGMHDLEVAPPRIETKVDEGAFELLVTLMPGVVADPARIGLSAVIEDVSGHKSYWALAHPPGKPDFHHPDCFALELPALEHP